MPTATSAAGRMRRRWPGGRSAGGSSPPTRAGPSSSGSRPGSPRSSRDNGCVNIAELAGAVVALTETRLPVRFDPDTLATLGVCEYDRHIKGPVSTAHPHFDHARSHHFNYVLDFGRRSKYHFFGIHEETGRQSVGGDDPR